MKIHKGYPMFLALIYLILALMLTAGSAIASPTQQAETDFTAIDTYVQEQLDKLSIPGMALGIVQDGQIAHLQGFGTADSTGRAVTPQTPFYIGSVTKSFTALAVMQLVEAGKIDLDAPVQTYLPWFELANKEASAQITVRNLLNQTSGISTKDGNRFWTSRKGLEETLHELNIIPQAQPVGAIYQYCSINFMVAGWIVEVVSGQPYSDYVTQHIFGPLDMDHSYASLAPARADGLSDGHYYIFGHAFKDERAIPPANLPAGHLIASIEDLSHYAVAQLNEGRYSDTSVLSPQGMTTLHAPAVPTEGDMSYAMGWTVGKWEGIPLIFHNGDPGNFHSDIILMPENGSGIVLLTNASGFIQMSQADQIAMGVLSMLTGKTLSPISMPFLKRFLYWSVLLTPLLQVIGIVFVWRNRQNIKLWGSLLTVILNLAAVFGLFALSVNIPFPLASMRGFYPDVAYDLMAVAVLGVGWSAIYTTMKLVARKAKK